MSRTRLLLGLFLEEYFLEYFVKNLQKILQFFYNLKNIIMSRLMKKISKYM
jgi:hypothetical protein